MTEALSGTDAALDLQTGGGEVFAEALGQADAVPAVVAATEGWKPNHALAAAALAPFGGSVSLAAQEDPLPFGDATFGLVTARHPVTVPWAEVARVLRPHGTFMGQLIGRGTNRGLYEFILGPQPDDDAHVDDFRRETAAAGLRLVRLADVQTRVVFHDLASVVHFLRKVVWTLPGFTVDGHRERLRAMYEHIEEHGSFECLSRRVLVTGYASTGAGAPKSTILWSEDKAPESIRWRRRRDRSRTNLDLSSAHQAA